MLEVFFAAMEDLDERRGRPIQPRNAGPLEMHFEHLLSTDPASSMVADEHGRVIAFGIVMVRGSEAFLSFLFVVPPWQRRGIGRALLDACLGGAAPYARLSTCAEADQPVSTALYASLGMAPRTPIYLLRGGLAGDGLPALPEGVLVRRLRVEAVARLDTEVLGYARPQDHVFWARGERVGWQYEDVDGCPLGYGYAHPAGRIGPVAAIEPEHLAGICGHLVRTTQVLEGRQIVVPGPAIAALRAVLAAGMRIDGSPAVYCAQGPTPQLDRYIPMSFALL